VRAARPLPRRQPLEPAQSACLSGLLGRLYSTEDGPAAAVPAPGRQRLESKLERSKSLLPLLAAWNDKTDAACGPAFSRFGAGMRQTGRGNVFTTQPFSIYPVLPFQFLPRLSCLEPALATSRLSSSRARPRQAVHVQGNVRSTDMWHGGVLRAKLPSTQHDPAIANPLRGPRSCAPVSFGSRPLDTSS